MEYQKIYEEVLLSTGLYKPIKVTDENVDALQNLLESSCNFRMDCYCPNCEKDVILSFGKKGRSINQTSTLLFSFHLNGFVDITVQCQRNLKHLFHFSFYIYDTEDGTYIMKCGQYPSVADLERHKIKKYQKVLQSDYRDFSKAIGLFSHGAGAGSYVYLRRIFENLINEAHTNASKENSNFNEEDFSRSRMNDKIKILGTDYLPKLLVENRSLYGIMSQSIHELSEDKCIELFPNVQFAIELILDEKIRKIEQDAKLAEAAKFIQNTASNLKNNS